MIPSSLHTSFYWQQYLLATILEFHITNKLFVFLLSLGASTHINQSNTHLFRHVFTITHHARFALLMVGGHLHCPALCWERQRKCFAPFRVVLNERFQREDRTT